MKINWSYIKLVLFIGITIFLFSFSNQRNAQRKLKGVEVNFLEDTNPFLTHSMVNKLLIQNNTPTSSIPKETLVLKDIEARLLQNPMVQQADVFLTIDGVLTASIQQRKPIGRVVGKKSCYLDQEGKIMPLSTVYSSRVPIITGFNKENVTQLTPLLLKIKNDAFMQKIISGVHLNNQNNIELYLRKEDFKVQFGNLKNIDKKIQNFKAFYNKAQRDKILNRFSDINLQFESQVVATKI